MRKPEFSSKEDKKDTMAERWFLVTIYAIGAMFLMLQLRNFF